MAGLSVVVCAIVAHGDAKPSLLSPCCFLPVTLGHFHSSEFGSSPVVTLQMQQSVMSTDQRPSVSQALPSTALVLPTFGLG